MKMSFLKISGKAVPDAPLFETPMDEYRSLTSVEVRSGSVYLVSVGGTEVLFDKNAAGGTMKGLSRKVLLQCRNLGFEVSREKNCSLDGDVTVEMRNRWTTFWKNKVIGSVSEMESFIELLSSFEDIEPAQKRAKRTADQSEYLLLESVAREVKEMKEDLKSLRVLVESMIKFQHGLAQAENGTEDPEPLPEQPLVDILMNIFREHAGTFFDLEDMERWDGVRNHSEFGLLEAKLELMQSNKMIVGADELYALPVKKTR